MKKIFFFIGIVLIELNANGQQYALIKQWDKRFGGLSTDMIWRTIQTKDNGYLLGGTTFSGLGGDKTQPNWDTANAYCDYWIVKTDASGNKEWDKRYGGFLQDNFYELKQTPDKGFLLAGESYSGIGGDKSETCRGGFDYWVIKTDSVGNKIWDKRFGGNGDDRVFTLELTKDGGFILSGWSNSGMNGDKTQPSQGSDDYWVVKADSNGNKQWDRRYGGANADLFYAMTACKDGSYLLGGMSISGIGGDKTCANWSAYYDIWIVKIDSIGNKIWDRCYGTAQDADHIKAVVETPDKGFLLGGFTSAGISGDKTQDTQGINDYWIIRIDSAGNKLWDKSFGGTKNDDLYTINLTNDGGFLLTGDSYSQAGGDKSEDNFCPAVNCNSWIVKTDSLGNKQWDRTMLFNGTAGVGNAFQTNDGCYVIANGSGPETGGYKSEPGWGGSDYWIMKFCMDTFTGITPLSAGEGLGVRISPNPFTTDLSIVIKAPFGGLGAATFTITNLTGATIYKKEETNLANGYTKMLDLSYLPNGIYFLTVQANTETTTHKIIKQ